ncbi:MAG: pantoate--beta-alanine ligase [Deltaproteobacteria bacterium]|jgi:pantoate--beta-alanine ligase|nr:pantoate--beta-alanine ligase [Deltaproteobacteria bacterium]MBW2542730.1 pantoate--beta-alanine ligase [Deltaproteobacteria bacterium]
MRIIGKVAELQALADCERAAGEKIALVPTMGALHAGHLSLVETARERADRVWVSIFVNPTQFESAAEASRYPRDRERDLQCCRDAGVDVVFAPEPDEMVDPANQTWVEVGEVARPLCGRSRPGHFRAVATIVAKLLLAAKPHLAVFGEKDYQQLAVIRRMVRDLGFDVEIVGAPTVREPDGLALSSRNVQLHPEARRQAVALVRALDAAEGAVASGELDAARLLARATAEIEKAPLARIDYVELRDAHSLGPVPEKLADPALLALAVYFDSPERDAAEAVRLIDNRVLDPRRASSSG